MIPVPEGKTRVMWFSVEDKKCYGYVDQYYGGRDVCKAVVVDVHSGMIYELYPCTLIAIEEIPGKR